MQEIHIGEVIHPCIKVTLDYMPEKRKETLPSLVPSGINFSIILGSACYLEGVLEAMLRALARLRKAEMNALNPNDLDTRRGLNVFYRRLAEDISERIGRTTGAVGYDEMFDLLIGQRLGKLRDIVPIWEGTTVLFNFRNVLCHGREVWARQDSGASVEGGFREEFSGSYKMVESYLIKKKLLDPGLLMRILNIYFSRTQLRIISGH